MKSKLYLILALALAACTGTKKMDYSSVKPGEWVLQKNDTLDYAIANYLGKQAFILKRNIGNYKAASIAYPKGLNFTDGTVELDCATSAGKDGFAGLAFHIQDSNHYEVVYFRPGSSGTVYAVQYMPKKKQEFNWWDYEAEKYQSTATLPLTGWFHIKVVVKKQTLTVYLDNQPKPVMVRNDLDPTLQNGSVGFWLGNCSEGAYKNLMVINNKQ